VGGGELFCGALSHATLDKMELSMCRYQDSGTEGIFIAFLEMYYQKLQVYELYEEGGNFRHSIDFPELQLATVVYTHPILSIDTRIGFYFPFVYFYNFFQNLIHFNITQAVGTTSTQLC